MIIFPLNDITLSKLYKLIIIGTINKKVISNKAIDMIVALNSSSDPVIKIFKFKFVPEINPRRESPNAVPYIATK